MSVSVTQTCRFKRGQVLSALPPWLAPVCCNLAVAKFTEAGPLSPRGVVRNMQLHHLDTRADLLPSGQCPMRMAFVQRAVFVQYEPLPLLNGCVCECVCVCVCQRQNTQLYSGDVGTSWGQANNGGNSGAPGESRRREARDDSGAIVPNCNHGYHWPAHTRPGWNT